MEHFADFGRNKQSYSLGRRGYPEAVFYYLKLFAKENEPVLDLGCGTGISTRQLLLNGFEEVQGVDRDEEMLDEAKSHRHSKYIPYWQAEAASMNFRSQFFQAITCFSSFHWFTDDDSIGEIRRVLKTKGVLFVVKKTDITPFKDEIKAAIEKRLEVTFPSLVDMNHMSERLTEKKFRVESIKSFEEEDLYSLAEAIEFIKSISFWAAIEEEDKPAILDEIVIPMLKEKLELATREKGRIIRRYTADCLVAHKT